MKTSTRTNEERLYRENEDRFYRDNDDRFYRDERSYRDDDRFNRFDREDCNGCRRDRDHDFDCDEDDEIGYDYCENSGDSCTDTTTGNGNTSNNNNHNHNCNCKDKCDHDRCDCDRDNRENCCEDGTNLSALFFDDRECCHETVHCSDRCDFNEDERFGCNTTEDAANSEENWFDFREEDNCCFREREKCEKQCRFCKRLLCRIQVLDFALEETILFLNTHPCDCEALRYYCEIRRKLERAQRLYERKCGPLTNEGVDTEFGWEWATCPWPWEGE